MHLVTRKGPPPTKSHEENATQHEENATQAWSDYFRTIKKGNQDQPPEEKEDAEPSREQSQDEEASTFTCTGCQQKMPKKSILHTYGDDCQYDFDYNITDLKPSLPEPKAVTNQVWKDIEKPDQGASSSSSSSKETNSISENQKLLNRLINRSDPVTPEPPLSPSENQELLNAILGNTARATTQATSSSDNTQTPEHAGISEKRFTYWPFWQNDGQNVIYISEQEPEVQNTFHARTRLKNSKCGASDGLLVDCGALGNLSGDELIERVAQKAKEMTGLETTYTPMPNPLTVEGVGQGSQSCAQMASVPMALSSGEQARYQAPIIPNSNVPALLGLATMERQHAIIDTHGQAYIVPGKGRIKIQLPPDSKVFPLEKAESGHLLLPMDCWHLLESVDPKTPMPVWHMSTATGSSDTTISVEANQA